MEESWKPNDAAVFSREETLAAVDGDRELLREVVGMFTNECTDSVAAIRKAIDEQSASGLDRSAHTLRGMAGNFGARAAVEAALKLEMMGRLSNLGGAGEVFAALQEELERLKNALERLIGEA